MKKLCVTRYSSLVDYLKKLKLIDDNTKVITHARIEDVRNCHVIGVLPYWLSCHSALYTEIQIRVPSEKRGKELSFEEVKFYSGDAKTYTVREVPFPYEDNEKEKK